MAYQQALLSLVQAQATRFGDTAALYQALGGGWWNRKGERPPAMTALPPRPMSLPLVDQGAGGSCASRSAVAGCALAYGSLWVLVSILWTVATLLRISEVWAPLIGWHRIIEGPWLWFSLIAPPLIFAIDPRRHSKEN